MWLEVLNQFFEPVATVGPELPVIALGLIVGFIIIKILSSLLRDTLKVARVPKALAGIIVSLVVIVMWIILFSELAREAGLSSLAIKISGSLLIVGLAAANGMSALAGDIVSGVFLAKDRDFEVGYRVRIGDVEGVIKKIDIRKTRIEDDKGNTIIIPNSKLDLTGWTVLANQEKG